MIRIDYSNGQGVATNASANKMSKPEAYSFTDIFNTLTVCNFLAVDGNGIDLSGTKQFADNNTYIGTYTDDISDSTDYTYQNTYVDFYGDFSDLSTTGLTISFYQTDIIGVYVNVYSGNTLKSAAAQTATDPFNTAYLTFNNTENCDKIRIFNIATNKNNSRVYIENIAKGNVTRGAFEKIKSHNLIEEINILSTDLPINQFEAVVASQTKPAVDSKIAVYSNDRYYGTFWVDEVEQVGKKIQYESNNETITVGDDLYAITAHNAVGLLERGSFRKWRTAIWLELDNETLFVGWAGVRLSEMLADIQSSTGVKVVSNESDYNASTLGLYGYIDRQSYRHNLCAAAFALGYMIDGSRSDRLYLKKIPSSVTKTYTNADIIGTATFNKRPKVTQVEYYKYPEATVEQIGTLEGSAQEYSKDNTYWFTLASSSGNDKYLDYDLSAIWIENKGTPTGTFDTFADRTLYHTYSKTEWLRLPISVQPTVEIIDVQQSSEENIEKYDYFSVQGVKNISTKPSSTSYLSQYQSAFTGTKLTRANAITTLARSGGVVNAKVILTDEKIGDLVTITTDFGEQVTGIITKMNIHFGYNDVADIEVTQYE